MGEGGNRTNNAYLNCTRGGRTPLIFLTRQKVYLVVDTTFSNWFSTLTTLSTTLACCRLVPWDCFRTLGMVGMVHPASSEPFLAFNSSLVDLALLRYNFCHGFPRVFIFKNDVSIECFHMDLHSQAGTVKLFQLDTGDHLLRLKYVCWPSSSH